MSLIYLLDVNIANFELRNKMQEKAFTEDEIDETIAYCQKKNWQNDKRFAENYLHARSQRGYGAIVSTRITSTERGIFRRNQ